MEETGEKEEKIVPTKSDGEYSAEVLTSLFHAHNDTINGEKQLIWMRYSVMLLANSIVLGMLANGDFSSSLGLITIIFGLLLSIMWLILTRTAWNFLEMRYTEANRFSWKGYSNPARFIQNSLDTKKKDRLASICEKPKLFQPLLRKMIEWKPKDWVRWTAMFTIGLFIVGYFVALVFALVLLYFYKPVINCTP